MSSLRLLRPVLRARAPLSLAHAPIAAPRFARAYATEPPKTPVQGDSVKASNRAKNESAVGVSWPFQRTTQLAC